MTSQNLFLSKTKPTSFHSLKSSPTLVKSLFLFLECESKEETPLLWIKLGHWELKSTLSLVNNGRFIKHNVYKVKICVLHVCLSLFVFAFICMCDLLWQNLKKGLHKLKKIKNFLNILLRTHFNFVHKPTSVLLTNPFIIFITRTQSKTNK